jgi:uncharacterized protein
MLTRILSALLLVTLPVVAHAAPFRWEGKWNRFGRQSGGMLEITKVTPNGFTFSLGASAGANMGEIAGTAKLRGDKATFSEKDPDIGETCDVTFQPKQVPGYRDQAIEVTASPGCSHYGGAGVFFDGEYHPGKVAQRFTAGFNCGAPKLSPVEEAICTNGLVAEADVALTKSFTSVLAKLPEDQKKALRTEQVAWLKTRNACGPKVACLVKSYRTRLAVLQAKEQGRPADDRALVRTLAAADDNPFESNVPFRLLLADVLGDKFEELESNMGGSDTEKIPEGLRISGCVRGICPTNRAWIALTKDGQVWAAFPDDTGEVMQIFTPKGKTREQAPASLATWLSEGDIQKTRVVAAFP